RLLEASTMKSRRGFAIQRLMNAMRQAHADGWFIVFDTLTLADDRLEAFYEDRKSGSAGMPRPISYAVFCLKKKKKITLYLLTNITLFMLVFSFSDASTADIYTLSLHDALPI